MPGAADVVRPRRFLVTWRDGGTPAGIHAVGRLVFDGRYHFAYLENAWRVPAFRPFPNFPELDKSYSSEVLFPFFAARVMDRRRPEHTAFLRALDLREDAHDLDVLARNEGARKGDGVAVVEEPDVGPGGATSHVFVVRGLRFALPDRAAREVVLEGVQRGTVLTVRRDEGNAVNPRALALTTPQGDSVGWVPDALVPYVEAVMESGDGQVLVQRRNGPEQPAHLRLLARVSGRVPAGFQALPQLAGQHADAARAALAVS